MSFLEGDEKEGSRPSQVFGSIQIVVHKVLSSLNSLSTMVVRTGIATGDTLWEPFLASWFLAIKSEEGNLFPLAWFRYFVCNPGVDFAAALARGQS